MVAIQRAEPGAERRVPPGRRSTSGPTSGGPPAPGVPGHVHVHALPRWDGDTNFMTAVAEARVLPESLRTSYDKLRAAWPALGSDAVTDELDATHRTPRRDRRRRAHRRAARGSRRHQLRRPDRLPRRREAPHRRDDLPRARGHAASRSGARARTRACSRSAILLALIGGYHFLAGWKLKVDETEALVIATRHRRLPGRPRVGAARLVRPAQPARVADPALQRGRAAEPARPRRVRRRRRPRDRRVHRDEPRGLVRVRPRRPDSDPTPTRPRPT